MSKKIKPKAVISRKPAPPIGKVAKKVVKTTTARNSPVPKAAPAAPKVVTYEMVAKRAYEIFRGGTGGDQTHNWLRAERELRGGL